MPLHLRRRGVCAEHGEWCRPAGGSDYVPPRCRRHVPDPVTGDPKPDIELDEMVAHLVATVRAERDGTTYEEARKRREDERDMEQTAFRRQ